MRLVEKEEATEREMERGEKCRHGRERKEGEREREKCFGEPTGTPDSKYPPDTLHLSLHIPSLSYLTTDASFCDRTEGRRRKRWRERTNDRSFGMPAVVPADRLKSF